MHAGIGIMTLDLLKGAILKVCTLNEPKFFSFVKRRVLLRITVALASLFQCTQGEKDAGTSFSRFF